MQSPVSRRRFFRGAAGTAFVIATAGPLTRLTTHAVQPFSRSGPPRLSLGLAAYSLRSYFKDINHKREQDTPASERIDMFQFVDYCAEQGCDGAELTSYYFPTDVTDEYLLRLRRHAFLRGIAVSGTAIGNTFTHPPGEQRAREISQTKKWIDRAAVLGAPHIRVFAGSLQDTSKEQAKKLCIEALEECGEYAGTKGIMLGLENHGGIVAEADDLLDIMRSVKSPWVGINLDGGNFHTADPYADLARCAPYSVNVQIKVEIQRRGQSAEPADLARMVKILRDANYQGYVTLEYESAENPRIAIPRHLARLKELLRAG